LLNNDVNIEDYIGSVMDGWIGYGGLVNGTYRGHIKLATVRKICPSDIFFATYPTWD
jgi:hypothetical protein